MTDKNILKKAIERAQKNGWSQGINFMRLNWTLAHDVGWWNTSSYFGVIFAHDFARAFWGDGKPSGETILDGPEWQITQHDGSVIYVTMKNWQYHLTQMALEEKPLDYLAMFL